MVSRHVGMRLPRAQKGVGLVAAAGSSAFDRRLTAVCAVLAAVTRVVESIAGLLRQLVQVAGWVVLLVGCVGLTFHPHLSLAYLVTPGGGALAVLQGVIRPRRAPGESVTIVMPSGVASRTGSRETGPESDEGRLPGTDDAAAVDEGVLR